MVKLQIVVLREKGTRCLHVAHARELQLEVDPVALALGLELRNLAARLLCGLGVLGRLGLWASSDAIFSSRSAICFS